MPPKKPKIPTPTSQPNFKLGNFYSPLGNVTSKGNNVTYTPTMGAGQKGLMDNTTKGLNQGVQSLSGYDFNPEKMLQNPYYDTTYKALTAPINFQHEQDQNSLNANLNSRNQGGSSYAALQHSLSDRNYTDALTGAAGSALNASSGAYNQAYQNQLSGLQGLSGLYGQQVSSQLAPAQLAALFQGNSTQANQALGGYNQGLYGLQNQQYQTQANMLKPDISIFHA